MATYSVGMGVNYYTVHVLSTEDDLANKFFILV